MLRLWLVLVLMLVGRSKDSWSISSVTVNTLITHTCPIQRFLHYSHSKSISLSLSLSIVVWGFEPTFTVQHTDQPNWINSQNHKPMWKFELEQNQTCNQCFFLIIRSCFCWILKEASSNFVWSVLLVKCIYRVSFCPFLLTNVNHLSWHEHSHILYMGPNFYNFAFIFSQSLWLFSCLVLLPNSLGNCCAVENLSESSLFLMQLVSS